MQRHEGLEETEKRVVEAFADTCNPATTFSVEGLSKMRADHPVLESMAPRINPLAGSSNGYAASGSVLVLLTKPWYTML
jgi:hypothetical protein